MISITLYNDPACPWAYSERPALRVLEWRYGDQLEWELVLIGLTEDRSQYEARGYTPLRGALGQLSFRRYGMPFSPAPKPRLSATARACRAVVATRMLSPGSEWVAFRALQLANFTAPILLDDDEHLRTVLARVPGIDADAIISRLDAPEVSEAYERDRAAPAAPSARPPSFRVRRRRRTARCATPRLRSCLPPMAASSWPAVFSRSRPTTS